MLGRMRTSSWSSLEALELERSTSSKLIKDDSHSIYETTLLKLKQGSRRDMNLDSTRVDFSTRVDIDHVVEEATMLDTECSSSDSSPKVNDCQPITIENEQQNKNVSVVSLFARYKKSHHALSLPDQKAMVIESACSSSNMNMSDIPNVVN